MTPSVSSCSVRLTRSRVRSLHRIAPTAMVSLRYVRGCMAVCASFVLIFVVVSLVRAFVSLIPLGAFVSHPWFRVCWVRGLVSFHPCSLCYCVVLVLSVKFVVSFASLGLRYREHRPVVVTSCLLRYRPRLLRSFVVASLINGSVPFSFARYVRRHSRRVFVRSSLRASVELSFHSFASASSL